MAKKSPAIKFAVDWALGFFQAFDFVQLLV
jgi:hypothetical protein